MIVNLTVWSHRFFSLPASKRAASTTVGRSGSTLRFVTIKCGQEGDEGREVFSRVLAAVTGTKTASAGAALGTLERLTEPLPFFAVVSQVQ